MQLVWQWTKTFKPPPRKLHRMEQEESQGSNHHILNFMFNDEFSPSNIQLDEKIHSKGNHLKNKRAPSQIDDMARMEMEHFYLDLERKEMLMEYYPYQRKSIHQHRRKSQSRKMFKSSKSVIRASTKQNSRTGLMHSHIASSRYGLTVILNPKEAEYTDALKNNFIGFKILVHTPYNFPEVDAVGMAMQKNVQATVGIRGHHSFITDAANALGLYQKKCLSRSDNIKKYKDVKLEVFAYYTKKNCILECHANIFFKKCGCLPYYYPDFSSSWNMTTNCNHTALQCISKLVGKNNFHLKISIYTKEISKSVIFSHLFCQFMIKIAFVQVIVNQHNMYLKLLLPGELLEILDILLKVTARKTNFWIM